METLDWSAIVGLLITAANAGWIIYSSYKKNKPEVKKLEHEADSEMAEATGVILEGTKLSGEILMARILELKNDLENEKRIRREESEYLRRRLRETERESRDYRVWAAKLAKQVIEAGQIPATFVPSSGDSEPFAAIKHEEDYQKEVKLLKKKEDEATVIKDKEQNGKQSSDSV